MELDIEFLALSFSADDEKYKSTRESHCRNEMGCHPWVFSLPRCSLLSEKWAPLTSFAPFAGCFITLRRPSSPASNRLLRRDIQTDTGKKSLRKSVCGSLRGGDCYQNISISKVRCRQEVSRFYNLRLFQAENIKRR